MRARLSAAAWLSGLALFGGAACAQFLSETNGFDVSSSDVPAEQILRGGPPRDGIPAIDQPVYESAAAAGWLDDGDWVIGVEAGGLARAYPIRILNWHEIVNDHFAGANLLVTFCPLCGTGVVFEAPPGNDRIDFGVSGLLYNSDVLLYDRATESLWSQILGAAVTGARRGEKLVVVPSLQTTWSRWRAAHPDSEVLSRQTGHRRDYGANPYAGYEKSERILFPVANWAAESDLHPKERVIGVVIDGTSKAYPFSALAARGATRFEDSVAGTTVVVNYDPEAPSAWLADDDGRKLASTDGFWFAWYAFYPESEIYAPN